MTATVKEAVKEVISQLSREDKSAIRSTTLEGMTKFHHNIGRGIRNHFKLWRNQNTKLKKDCLRVCKENYPDEYEYQKQFYGVDEIITMHPDDASGIILSEIWQELQ